MATPYRAHGDLGTTLPDPTRARTALGLVGVGGVLSFIALVVFHFTPWDHALATMLALGGATIILGLAIAGWSHRSALAIVAALTLAFAYVSAGPLALSTNVRFAAACTWPVRYASIAASAIALLVLYRRLQRRSFGFPLRLAAIIGAHWALVRLVSLWVDGAAESSDVELLARFSWLFLGIGAWQLRRYLGISLPVAPDASDLGASASTRLAVSGFSFAVRLALLVEQPHEAALVACSIVVDALGIAVACFVEVPAYARVAPERAPVALGTAAVTLVPALLLFSRVPTALWLMPTFQIAPALALTTLIQRKQPEHRRIAVVAVALQVAASILALLV